MSVPSRRSPLLLALALLAGPAAAADAPPAQPDRLREVEQRIASAGAHDPLHPLALAARLELASLLASEPGPDCTAQLARAERVLDEVAGQPATRLLLHDAAGDVAAARWRIAWSYSECVADEALATRILQDALARAREAVDAYRAAWNYELMAVMQFNVASTLRELGDDAGAIAALEAAIAMDREFLLADDARENYAMLLEWRDGQPDPERVAALMADFPARNPVELRFDWRPAVLDVRLEARQQMLSGGELRSRGLKLGLTTRIERAQREWLVSSEAGEAVVDAADGLADATSRRIEEFIAAALAAAPTLAAAADGSEVRVRDAAAFTRRIEDELSRLVGELLPADEQQAAAVREEIRRRTGALLAPAAIEAEGVQGFQLETGLWIGATLDPADSYQLQAFLTTPGVPGGVMEHSFEFAVTRWLPCADGEAGRRCVEIVGVARPLDAPRAEFEQRATERTRRDAPDAAPFQYWAERRLRLVTDPATLMVRATEVREYAYLGGGPAARRQRTATAAHSRYDYRPR